MSRDIEATFLDLPETPGIQEKTLLGIEGHGLHAILGPNNGGKTMLLRAIQKSTMGAVVNLAAEEPPPRLEHETGLPLSEWKKLPPTKFRWPRNLPEPASPDPRDAPAGLVVDRESQREATLRTPHMHPGVWPSVLGFMWTRIVAREALLVPTNRYFPEQAPLGVDAQLADTANWSSLLGNLQRSDDPNGREAFRAIAEHFREITEGLGLTSFGTGGTSIIHIEGDGMPARRLGLCGDGLRDIVGLLLHAVTRPHLDLLLDEPGMRLHATTQRRLLRFLDGESRRRAIWLTSHDGVFVGAPVVRRRFHVWRDRGQDISHVGELPDRASTRSVLLALGWEPGDALLADRVLLCEGPTDRIALEAIRCWLQEDDPTWGGLVVADLGGDGAVIGDDPEVVHRIDLARAVAPHANLVVLLDSSGRTDNERKRWRQRLEKHGGRLVFLNRPELENYWTEPALVYKVLTESCERASSKQMEPVTPPALGQVEATLASFDAEAKGSTILEAVWKLAVIEYPKKDAAICAAEWMRDHARSSAQALKAEVEALFPKPSP